MSKGIFARKTIQSLLNESEEKRGALKRSLGPMNLTNMGVGAIIGAGLFVLIGSGAAEYAGPGVILSFVIAAILCIFSALCYAEFASLIPVAGSAYSYAYATLGEFAAWVIGWVLAIGYLCSPSTVSVGWSAYFVSVLRDFGCFIPAEYCNAPLAYTVGAGWAWTGYYANIPAILILAIVGYMVCVGVQTASFVNNLLVIIKLVVILLFLVCGAAFIQWDHLIPLIPENTGTFGQFGWSGVMRGAGVVFFAYIGFDAISTLGQEAKNPQRDLPIGMLASLICSTIVYILVAVVLLGIVSYTELGVADPIALAINNLGPSFVWLRFVVKIGILIGLTSVILVMMLALPRILYTMSKDGLLPSVFGRLHAKLHTPLFTSVFVSLLAIMTAGIFPVDVLGQLTSMSIIFVFGIVCLGILVLRRMQPTLHRPFRTPWVPFIPLLGVLSCIGQMLAMPGITWRQLIVWVAIGMVVYGLYGSRHSKVRHPHHVR